MLPFLKGGQHQSWVQKKTKIRADWSCHTPTSDEVGTFLDKSAGIQNGKSLSSILSLLTDYPCKHVFKLILFSEFFFFFAVAVTNELVEKQPTCVVVTIVSFFPAALRGHHSLTGA